jgi:small subunit ribosomal protein S16
MLAIRLQRTGRKGHAQFRLIVQESRMTPSSGKVVVTLGNYDPHSKVAAFDKEKAAYYLEHGAQPSERVAMLLKREGVKLPKWVKLSEKQSGKIRNPDKLRRNRPAEEAPAEPAAAEAEAEPQAADTPADEPTEKAASAESADAAASEVAEEAAEPSTGSEFPAEGDAPAGDDK